LRLILTVMSSSSLIDDLKWRGLYADCTDLPGLAARMGERPISLYCGFDPTSNSLQVGNLVPLFALRRFQLAGHHPIALAGGATGMIGDPSGRSTERNLLTSEQLEHNIAGVKVQLAKFLDFEVRTNPARLVNNHDWFAPISYLDFLRDVGKHFPINWMVAKDSVRSRMEGEAGISYTEFSYMLLQAYDFYHLRSSLECELQIGATDQWGNITAGTELIRRKAGASAWGLVLPLLTKADGTKYGKSAEGTVWLDPQRTSTYRFYQFFMQADDSDVVKLLKALTFVPREEIEALENEVTVNPGGRAAQKRLAREVTTLVHGAGACEDAVRASELLFGASATGVSVQSLRDIAAEIPGSELPRATFAGTGINLVDLLATTGLSPSKGQSRRDIESGGIYVNNERAAELTRAVDERDLLHGRYVLLRKGKKNYLLVQAV
jgi:tyrosyl-tRNA synthetase